MLNFMLFIQKKELIINFKLKLQSTVSVIRV